MLVIQVFDQYSIVSETLKNQYYQMQAYRGGSYRVGYGRVDEGSYLPPPPTDPDVRN